MLPRPGKKAPIIIERLLIRRQENLRDYIPAGRDARRPPFKSKLRGMPMGLPALSDHHIEDLWAYVEQGCRPPEDGVGLDGMATFRNVIALLRPGMPFYDPLIRPLTEDRWKQNRCGIPPLFRGRIPLPPVRRAGPPR